VNPTISKLVQGRTRAGRVGHICTKYLASVGACVWAWIWWPPTRV